MRITKSLVLIGALLGWSLDPNLASAGQNPATPVGAASTGGGLGANPQTSDSTTQPPVAGIAHKEELTGDPRQHHRRLYEGQVEGDRGAAALLGLKPSTLRTRIQMLKTSR